MEHFFLLSRGGMAKSAIEEFRPQKDACNPFLVAQTLLSDSQLGAVRRELRRVSPGAKIGDEDVSHILREEVIKRELVVGEDAKAAAGRVKRAASRALRKAAPVQKQPRSATEAQ